MKKNEKVAKRTTTTTNLLLLLLELSLLLFLGCLDGSQSLLQ